MRPPCPPVEDQVVSLEAQVVDCATYTLLNPMQQMDEVVPTSSLLAVR